MVIIGFIYKIMVNLREYLGKLECLNDRNKISGYTIGFILWLIYVNIWKNWNV